MTFRIETKRLGLREYTPDDFDTLYEIMSDPETMQHYPAPFDEERTKSWIDWNLDNYRKYGFGLWAVVLKETGEFIGDCGITIQNIDGEMLPEIGYHIHKKHWRKGYAGEAARAVRDWAFRNTEYDIIYSYMKYTNVASYSTAMANGMKKVKEYPDPKNTVSYAYAITRAEWEALTDRAGITDYRIVDQDSYYRKGVFRHFSEDCKCSTSMTARVDVTELAELSKKTGTKFYLNFLYVLSKALNSREDYRMGWLWETRELICYNQINPTQYVFHEDTETCTPVYTTYTGDYDSFYRNALDDLEKAKHTREYGLDTVHHPNWFDASYISWLSYDSMNIELPDGYLYFMPIVNWGRYREEKGRLMMPVSVRLNHAIADGYLVANVFRQIEKEMANLCRSMKEDEKG